MFRSCLVTIVNGYFGRMGKDNIIISTTIIFSSIFANPGSEACGYSSTINNNTKNKSVADDNNGTCSRSRKESRIERLFVAPKSSLLRLVIDGIPIHVFTCSTTTELGHMGQQSHIAIHGPATSRTFWDLVGYHICILMIKWRVARLEMAFEQGNGFAGEYRLRRFDGNYPSFYGVLSLRDLKGRIIHWFGTCTDVHDQHSTIRQMEIESNERKYRLLAEAIPQIVFTFSPGVGVTYANEKWECYSGFDFDRTKGFGFMSQVHADDRNVRWFGTCTDINDHKLLEHKLKNVRLKIHGKQDTILIQHVTWYD
ncbi:hypothetical protein O0I10_004781 [Lichtheimia ornata]|uniref:PAS domain-containing protein n=1 Tax=Lichtheimia ornata TaxID=688661 RepID=A0AAD7V4W3_9FUNG|nr:uncharacterized protein O0I10_004781 [Lichtheimia ornata]KAJ8659418.1 hypothetical protein O0I10_004781 [Lichtheimia ornata]